MTDNSTLVAALFDGNADCPRVQFLYQHTREQFSLISGKHGNIDSSESIDIARAKKLDCSASG